ncbi:EAL domain-containing protein [Alkalibacillus haloalkaliphilus]|uniref:EAL domain-containing protein n=1 Tax=Alkalibacillus haloalkaliphilus TaxID=94136 RepID=UPI0029353D67|nr:EAL domain-containing protein [Alkalibacillus haloalkaliphilus]MDV2581772.1 EAL domain-containing protein [Alkalibacillus haloalkaliphilus]
MTNKLTQLIDDENFTHYFQPIYDLDRLESIGYEALLRTELYDSPREAFRDAIKGDRLLELEEASIRKVVEQFAQLNSKHQKLFINVYPSTIVNEHFKDCVKRLVQEVGVSFGQVVFEIKEAEVAQVMSTLSDRIKELRNEGFLIAIDDFGRGATSIYGVVELNPSILKMDRYFARDLSSATSIQKKRLVESMVSFCNNSGIDIILEGIEKPKELEVAKQIGVRKGQGFLLGKPVPFEQVETLKVKHWDSIKK